MPDWLEFQKGTQELGSQLGDYFRQKKAQQDAIQMMLLKAKIEGMSDPLKVAQSEFLNRILSGQGIMPRTNAIDTTGTDEAGKIVGVDRQPYPESINIGGFGFKFPTPPEIQRQQIEQKAQEATALAEAKMKVPPQKIVQDLQKAELAYQNLKYMKDKAETLPSGYRAIGSNIGNFFLRGELNPELALYEKQMPAMAVAIYREITGDTRLSDYDARDRAYPLLWSAKKGEGESIKVGVFKDLEKLYQARIALIRKGAYKPNPKDPTEMITPLEDVMAEAGLNKGGKSSISQSSDRKYIKTGTYNGKKVGQLPDGTIEVIQ